MYISRIDVAQSKNPIKFKSKNQVFKKSMNDGIDFLNFPENESNKILREKYEQFRKFMNENFPVRSKDAKDDSVDPFVEDKWSC